MPISAATNARGGDVEAEGREVLAGADRERERERGDEDHARHDARGRLARLARLVEAGLPEDEHEQQDQERRASSSRGPRAAPRGSASGRRSATRSASARVEADHEPGDVDRDQATTLASRRARVFRGIGERMYGRLERASATGSPFSGSAATRRSYLANHRGSPRRPSGRASARATTRRRNSAPIGARVSCDAATTAAERRRRARRDRAAARRAAAAARRGTARAPRSSSRPVARRRRPRRPPCRASHRRAARPG